MLLIFPHNIVTELCLFYFVFYLHYFFMPHFSICAVKGRFCFLITIFLKRSPFVFTINLLYELNLVTFQVFFKNDYSFSWFPVTLPADGAEEFWRQCHFDPDVFIYVQRGHRCVVLLLPIVYLYAKRSLPCRRYWQLLRWWTLTSPLPSWQNCSAHCEHNNIVTSLLHKPKWPKVLKK